MNKNIRRNMALLALPLAFALGACDDDDDPMAMEEEATIVQTAQQAGPSKPFWRPLMRPTSPRPWKARAPSRCSLRRMMLSRDRSRRSQ